MNQPPEGPEQGASVEITAKPAHSLLLNWISFLGGFFILAGFVTGLSTLALDYFAATSLAYTGLFYLVYLLLILIGAVLVPTGMWYEHHKRADVDYRPPDLVIDLKNTTHQVVVFAFLTGGLLVLIGFSVGSYKAYHATESNAFCGQLCHTVMTPEYTTYQYSSHARVDCVECHIGEGAEWYVRSKISGLRQIWAVAINSFPRPIPTPIENLRPARETCEQCHWPRKFIGYKEDVRTYYAGDEDNTRQQLRMLLKIGGEENTLMRGAGIHYHMLLANKVEYIPRDDKRQEIAWVRVVRDDLTETVYEDTFEPLSEEEKQTMETRTMDCMDCHNRPSHKYPAPMDIVNQAMQVGNIDPDLPYVKAESVIALDQDYATTREAMDGIEQHMMSFYADEYPDVLEDQRAAILEAVNTLQDIYRRSIFPSMDAKWSAYPDNIGHRDWKGCFRCHNDWLESSAGEQIPTECNICHIILAQGEDISEVNVNMNQGKTFIHPADGEPMEEWAMCTDCHSGGAGLY